MIEPDAIFLQTSFAPYVEKYHFSEKNNLFHKLKPDYRRIFCKRFGHIIIGFKKDIDSDLLFDSVELLKLNETTVFP